MLKKLNNSYDLGSLIRIGLISGPSHGHSTALESLHPLKGILAQPGIEHQLRLVGGAALKLDWAAAAGAHNIAILRPQLVQHRLKLRPKFPNIQRELAIGQGQGDFT